ncbi:MAG TPA: ArsI/CadI family heavy metal resistance metalloenzyme [Candidatus Binatia bacterium]|nr:ArsI/CadI family heavy metal resistance metalloenzyme [Candidatus Binatia bacterium]
MPHNTFHVAIYVKDIPTAVEHYTKIFGLEPAKVKADYAKFELADPPVIFSLNLGGEPGTVSHLGIRYPGTGEVVTELLRTKRQGLEVLEQQGTTCCYAKADKFWVRDADGAQWEMYTLLEDVEARTAADSNSCGFLGQPQARETLTRSDMAPAGACCAPTRRGQ